jgi:hypothetical protein
VLLRLSGLPLTVAAVLCLAACDTTPTKAPTCGTASKCLGALSQTFHAPILGPSGSTGRTILDTHLTSTHARFHGAAYSYYAGSAPNLLVVLAYRNGRRTIYAPPGAKVYRTWTKVRGRRAQVMRDGGEIVIQWNEDRLIWDVGFPAAFGQSAAVQEIDSFVAYGT